MSTAERSSEHARAVAADGLDPVTFEVIRHRLWAINDDQGRMAARLCGSFIVYEGHDFNAALITADGRGLYCGVYILHHGSTIDEFVRHVLEAWPRDEIREGDMFFTNDPWWGALHANDGILVMPIFWEGELVAWSGITMHDNDVGSQVPGSFVTGARDRFGEAPLLPGIKMVENFEPRADVERAFLRNSRTPEFNALNMRARVAALRTTHQRIQELIGQYGIGAFVSAQEEIIAYVERVVRGRLRELPDGSWYAQTYHDHDSNDPNVYRLCCRLTKRGDELTFDFTGTSPQAPGPINCAAAARDGAVVGVILTCLCYDLPWAIAGLRNLMTIVSEEGTLNNAVGAAAVSMASVMGTMSTQDVVAHAFSKMLLCSERYRSEAHASWSTGFVASLFVAQQLEGEPMVGVVTDAFAGGGGARTSADGIDSGGIFHSMSSTLANAETIESRVPALQIYRREVTDGGGPGRFRGGTAVEFGSVPHKLPIPPAVVNTFAFGVAVPGGRGLSGGQAGAAVSNVVQRGSDVRAQLAEGSVPTRAADVRGGQLVVQAAKSLSTVDDSDVVIGVGQCGAGFGDPIRRDPELVAHDVAEGLVSEAMAASAYGVELEACAVHPARTRARRDAIRRERLERARPVDPTVGGGVARKGEVLHPIADSVEAAVVEGRAVIRCTVCSHVFADYDQDYKRGTVMREVPLTAASPLNDRCDPDYLAREFYCPGCATSVAVDIQHRDEPILEEAFFFAAGPGRA